MRNATRRSYLANDRRIECAWRQFEARGSVQELIRSLSYVNEKLIRRTVNIEEEDDHVEQMLASTHPDVPNNMSIHRGKHFYFQIYL